VRRYVSTSEMPAAERIERGYLGSLPRLTLLAPELVEAILDGLQSEGLGLPWLLEPFEPSAAGSGWPGVPTPLRPAQGYRRTSSIVTPARARPSVAR
jgi:hypothetical protein